MRATCAARASPDGRPLPPRLDGPGRAGRRCCARRRRPAARASSAGRCVDGDARRSAGATTASSAGGCSCAAPTGCNGRADCVLQLNAEQTAGLRHLQRERDLALLGRSSRLAFPEHLTRLGERYPQLHRAGRQRGAAHGFTPPGALARYLACWVRARRRVRGQAGLAWAAALLAATGRARRRQAFQLCRGARELLCRAAGPRPRLPAAALRRRVRRSSTRRCRTPATSATLGRIWASRCAAARGGACSSASPAISTCSTCARSTLASREQLPAASMGSGGACRSASAPVDALTPRPPGARSRCRGRRGIAVLCPTRRPRDRRGMRACACACAPRIAATSHPWARLNDSRGVRDWRGALAGDVTWSACRAEPGRRRRADGSQPTIAAETEPPYCKPRRASCGLATSGAPMGDLHLRRRGLPRRPAPDGLAARARPAPRWPDGPAARRRSGAAAAASSATASRSTRRLAGRVRGTRPSSCTAGLGRLASAWERDQRRHAGPPRGASRGC